jgi:GT2 family glycosyltransferase
MKWTSLSIDLDLPSDIKPQIEIVSASRLSAADFWNTSALGRSLRRMAMDRRISSRILNSNSLGLPSVYNSRIEADDSQDILMFIHDDVWIDDLYLVERIMDGLEQFDLIGVAGNRRSLDNQTVWGVEEPITPESTHRLAYLSGRVAHGNTPQDSWVSMYGPSGLECELLDGVMLAAKKATLIKHGLRFDPRFDFHFYDLDLCRSARGLGLRLGTWPIALTHQSKGNYHSPTWAAQSQMYLDKWRDSVKPMASEGPADSR